VRLVSAGVGTAVGAGGEVGAAVGGGGGDVGCTTAVGGALVGAAGAGVEQAAIRGSTSASPTSGRGENLFIAITSGRFTAGGAAWQARVARQGAPG
jgi:hypothetical protein